jgi:hypothetical protein
MEQGGTVANDRGATSSREESSADLVRTDDAFEWPQASQLDRVVCRAAERGHAAPALVARESR